MQLGSGQSSIYFWKKPGLGRRARLAMPAAAVGSRRANGTIAHYSKKPGEWRLWTTCLRHQGKERVLHHVLGRSAPLPSVEH
jgi:hypothetical protein